MAKNDVRVDKTTYELYTAVAVAAQKLNIQWMVVGATGRVMLLESIYGLPPGKATEDVDFGVMVESWNQYQALGDHICQDPGFTRDAKQQQRIQYSAGAYLDLVPFGKIESKDHIIAWPPEQDLIMNVSGFREAYADAIRITINGELQAPVVSPAGLILLKLIAWHERHKTHPKRDAADITYLLRHASKIETEDALFDRYFDAVESADYDIDLAGARVLGRRAGALASTETRRQLLAILNYELNEETDSLLLREIKDSLHADSMERARQLLDQFRSGLSEKI